MAPSQAYSIASSKRTPEQKLSKLRHAIMKIDEQNEGIIKEDLFFNLLDCMDICIDSESLQKIKSGFIQDGKVKYMKLLNSLEHQRLQDDVAGHWSLRKNRIDFDSISVKSHRSTI